MKRISNWFFGSFFRTLGRILVYIFIGYLISLLLKDIKLPKLSISNFLFTNVYADSLNIRETPDGYVVVNDNSNEYQTYIINPNSSATHRIIMATALSQSEIYSFMFFDVCSTRDIDAIRTSSPGQSCENSCWSNQVNTEKTNFNCTTNGQSGKIYRITTPIQKWRRDEGDLMASVDDRITIRNLTTDIISTTLYGFYVSNDANVAAFNIDYTNIINNIGNRQITAIDAATSAINNSTEENRQQHEETMDTLTDDSPPTNLDSLSNSAGWLPAGPVDSILNLPLSFLTNLNTNLSKSCQPVELPLPFIDKTLPLPCVNLLYSQIDGVTPWINTVGIIASAFMLFGYLISLYKYVDDTLTFRENNYLDNWSGL